MFDCARYVIEEYNPDLILITGDLVYGEFDDNESILGVDWQCDQLKESKYRLFEQRELTGNGNYSVGIVQGGKLTRAFFMMDSNGCGAMSQATMENGHSKADVGFAYDQIEWYTGAIQKIHEESPETKVSMAFHIQCHV